MVGIPSRTKAEAEKEYYQSINYSSEKKLGIFLKVGIYIKVLNCINVRVLHVPY